MYKAKKMKKKTSKKLFRRTAKKVQRKNFRSTPMRGGIRL